MFYWTDISRGMQEIPCTFMPVSKDCELYKKGMCVFKEVPSCVCNLGFKVMSECGCIKILKKDEEKNEAMGTF